MLLGADVWSPPKRVPIGRAMAPVCNLEATLVPLDEDMVASWRAGVAWWHWPDVGRS